MRHIVGQEVGEITHHQGAQAEQQEEQRCRQVDQAGKAVQPVPQCRKVVDPLHEAEAALEQALLMEHHLEGAAGPAPPLGKIGRVRLRCQAGREILIDVDRLPAAAMQQDRGVQILGDRRCREPTDLLQGSPAEHGARSTVEARVVDVPPRLDDVVEHVLFVRDVLADVQAILEQVGVVEVVRRLDLGHLRVAEESHGFQQECPHRYMVGVEGDHQIRRGVGQAVVEIARLRAGVVLAAQVVGAEAPAEFLDFRPVTVIEDHDPLALVVHGLAADDGAVENLRFLVVSGDEDIHAPPAGRRVRGYLALPGAGRDDVMVKDNQEPVNLRQEDRQADGDSPATLPVEGLRGAPPEVAHGDDQVQGDDHGAPARVPRDPAAEGHRRPAQQDDHCQLDHERH